MKTPSSSPSSEKIAKFVTIARQIQSGTYQRKTEIDLRDYFDQVSPDNWIPNPDTRIQVRDTDRSLAFVDEIYNTIITTGDASLLDDIVLVYFKKTEEFKIIGGNHTAEIKIRLAALTNDYKCKVFVVVYEDDLEGRDSVMIDFGNELNNRKKRERLVTESDVKNIVLTHIDENVKMGLKDPKPTKEWKENLQARYPFVSMRTIAQWCSHDPNVGGRRNPKKSWTTAEKEQHQESIRNKFDYQGYYVIEPRGLTSWNQTAVSTIVNHYVQNPLQKDYVLIFFAENAAQSIELESGDIRAKIEERYNLMRLHLGINIKVEYMRTK
jgi:hypothetical protein